MELLLMVMDGVVWFPGPLVGGVRCQPLPGSGHNLFSAGVLYVGFSWVERVGSTGGFLDLALGRWQGFRHDLR